MYVHGELQPVLSGVENATVIWVVDDFDSFKGIELVKTAARFRLRILKLQSDWCIIQDQRRDLQIYRC